MLYVAYVGGSDVTVGVDTILDIFLPSANEIIVWITDKSLWGTQNNFKI